MVPILNLAKIWLHRTSFSGLWCVQENPLIWRVYEWQLLEACGQNLKMSHILKMPTRLFSLCSKCEKFRLQKTRLVRSFHLSRLHNTVELTRVRYPNLKRGPYSQVNDRDISRFKEILPGAERVITDSSELVGFNTDWMKTCRGENNIQTDQRLDYI